MPIKQITYYTKLAIKGNTTALKVPSEYKEVLKMEIGDMVKVTIQKVEQ